MVVLGEEFTALVGKDRGIGYVIEPDLRAFGLCLGAPTLPRLGYGSKCVADKAGKCMTGCRLGAKQLPSILTSGRLFSVEQQMPRLELTSDEALVLFEWLARLDDRDALPTEDPAEEQVLWSLHGQLEKALTEPFQSN